MLDGLAMTAQGNIMNPSQKFMISEKKAQETNEYMD